MIKYAFNNSATYQNTDAHDSTHSVEWWFQQAPEATDYITNSVINIGVRERPTSFPITSMFGEAVGRVKTVKDLPVTELTKNKFKWKFKLPESCFKTTTTTVVTTDAGRNGEIIHIPFPDSFFVKHTTLMNQYGTLLRIVDNPTRRGTESIYPCALITDNKRVGLEARDLQKGTRWIAMWQSASINYSRGYTYNWKDSKHEMGFMYGVLRKSKQMSGAAGVVEFQTPIPTDKGSQTFKMFIDKANYELLMDFQEDWEDYLMYSKRNYNKDGEVFLFDEDNQEPVITSDGLLEQITNKEYYTHISPDRLSSTVDNLFYEMRGTNKELLMVTGTDGARWISEALRDKAMALGTGDVMASKLIGGTDPQGLTLNESFFTTYVTAQKNTIRVVKADYFDHGKVAQIREKHPVTGHSLESSRIVMLDVSTRDGQSNLNIVKKKNRSMIQWNVSGSLSFDKNAGMERATGIDGGSKHFLTEGGIFMYDWTTSLDMQVELC